MGCDIHAVIDYDDSRGCVQALADGDLWLPRDYRLFGALAGVRAVPDNKPLFPPRGLPPRFSEAVGRLFFQLVVPDGEENQGWLQGLDFVVQSVADDWVKRKASFYSPDSDESRRFVSNPDWHTPSWLNYIELPAALVHCRLKVEEQSVEFRAAVAAMAVLAGDYGSDRVRLVIWFDN